MAELVIALMDLLEAEARELRAGILRLQFGMRLVLLGGTLVLAGTALVLWGAYHFLAARLGPPAGALVSGVFILLLGGGFLWASRRIAH